MFNGKYVSLKELIYRIKRNPFMNDASIYDIAADAMDVLKMIGAPIIHESKIETIPFVDYRVEIPNGTYLIDYVNIVDGKRLIPLAPSQGRDASKVKCISDIGVNVTSKLTYSIKKNYIYMDVEEGIVAIEFKGIALDDEGLPLIPDNVNLMKAITAYVKIQHFEILVEMGDMNHNILSRVEREYAWNLAAAESSFKMPSDDEMESIRGGLVRMISNYRAGKERFAYEHLNRINP